MGPSCTLQAAKLLADARRSGIRLNGLPPDLMPGDIEQGYAIQLVGAQLRDGRTAGFKIGLTSAEAQRSTGANAPIVGRLAAQDLHRTADKIATNAGHLRIVEAEILFQMGRDLIPGDMPFTEVEIADSIAGAFAGIEICDSRFSNGDELSLSHLVADDSNADRVIIGEAIDGWRSAHLEDLPVTLTLRGRPAIIGSTARVLGHPVRAVTWLANWLAGRGEVLREGQFIASGSCTGFIEASPIDLVVARFGGRAQVSADFVTPT
jgi:2-keto-4-pentenoate hydratase